MNRCARTVLILVLVMMAAGWGPTSARDGQYKPVKVRMMPGIRALADAVRLSLIRPNLEDAGGDWLFASDLGSESISGASNYATAMGNGRLSVAISPWAELTVFRWPHVTHSDQLRYFTYQNPLLSVKARPVRLKEGLSGDYLRYARPVEPCPGLGSMGGVMAGGDILWTSDPAWKTSRSFTPDNSVVLETRLTIPGQEIRVRDWVDPESDLMVRNFQVEGDARRFFYRSTFAPWQAAPGEYDQSDPKGAGFAVVYSETDRAAIHFKPVKEDKRRLERIDPGSLDAGALDRAFPEGGVFVAWGFMDAPSGFQVGGECEVTGVGPACSIDDPYPCGGRLSGARVIVGGNEAVLSADVGGGGEVTVLIAVAGSATGAVGLIERARSEGLESMKKHAVRHWKEVSGRIPVPHAAVPVTARVARRSVLNLIQGQDRETGAIVASLSRQPHYHFDWPRDGAFFDLTLDLAGFPEKVTDHHRFYQRTQYRDRTGFALIRTFNLQSPFYRPAGHWPANMAVDGSAGSIPGGAIPFEIDETGLLVWDFWRHERSLPACEREAYIEEMRDTLVLAAEALMDYIDLKKGWTRPAVEDDNFPPDATLHGAASVLTGIASACDAGPRWGVSPEMTERWCSAARVLRAGIRGRIELPETMDAAGWRGMVWTLWPAPVFDDYDEPGARLLEDKVAESIRRKINKDRAGFAYLGEDVFILALADRARGEHRDLLQSALRLLTHEAAFPGTDCFGEVTLWGDFAGTGERVAQQRTSIPHLWNGVTVYLSALAVYEPERFEGMRPPTP